MDKLIQKMVSDSDFYVKIAGEALAKLREVYGESMSRADVRHVVLALQGFDFGRLVFTVTIAGGERHDGEKPFTYVVNATSADAAWKMVRDHFIREQTEANPDDVSDEDADVVRVSVEAGVPSAKCGYHWNDLRV